MEEDQDIDINNTDNDKAKRAKGMDDALAQKLPVPWVYTDGTADPANSTDWKLVEPWIEDTPKPREYTKLSDLQVFNVISQDVSQSDKYRFQSWDSGSQGEIQPDRALISPTVHAQHDNKVYYLGFKHRQIIL